MATSRARAGSAAGYSGTPLPTKLGIRPGSTVVLVHPPEGFGDVLTPLPDDVKVSHRLPSGGREVDVAVLFTTSEADLRRRFARVAAAVTTRGGLWVAWPKRASAMTTDLDENVVREVGLGHGLVDNKVCAVTEVWSGLRFVVRLRDR